MIDEQTSDGDTTYLIANSQESSYHGLSIPATVTGTVDFVQLEAVTRHTSVSRKVQMKINDGSEQDLGAEYTTANSFSRNYTVDSSVSIGAVAANSLLVGVEISQEYEFENGGENPSVGTDITSISGSWDRSTQLMTLEFGSGAVDASNFYARIAHYNSSDVLQDATVGTVSSTGGTKGVGNGSGNISGYEYQASWGVGVGTSNLVVDLSGVTFASGDYVQLEAVGDNPANHKRELVLNVVLL